MMDVTKLTPHMNPNLIRLCIAYFKANNTGWIDGLHIVGRLNGMETGAANCAAFLKFYGLDGETFFRSHRALMVRFANRWVPIVVTNETWNNTFSSPNDSDLYYRLFDGSDQPFICVYEKGVFSSWVPDKSRSRLADIKYSLVKSIPDIVLQNILAQIGNWEITGCVGRICIDYQDPTKDPIIYTTKELLQSLFLHSLTEMDNARVNLP